MHTLQGIMTPQRLVHTSPMRYFKLLHGIFVSPFSSALVRYVLRMSMQTWKSDSLKS